MGLGGADLSHSFSLVSPKSSCVPGMALGPSTSAGVLSGMGDTP